MITPTNPQADKQTCQHHVSWWDGEYEGDCELPLGHAGPHYDGVSCFTDDNEEVELKSKPIPPLYIDIQYQKQGQILNRQTLAINATHQVVTFQPEPSVNIYAEVKS